MPPCPSHRSKIHLPAADDQGVHWTADGKTLYFDSFRDGPRYLYRSTLQGQTFGPATAIAELNTSTFNASPVPSADELTLYFSSNRAPTTDDGDIFMATRKNKSDPFTDAAPVGNVNSTGLDAPTHITANGCHLYLGSTRDGLFHVYLAERPKL